MARPRGSPNKVTVQRKLTMEHRALGIPLAKQVLEDFMLQYVEAAKAYMPKQWPIPDDDEAEANARKFHFLADKAAFYARALAPYQSPTFRSIEIQPPRDTASRGTPAVDALEAFVLTLAAVRRKQPEPKVIEPEPDDTPTLVAVRGNGGGS